MQGNDDLVPLDDREFAYIANLMYDRFGIHLGDQKRVLTPGEAVRAGKRPREGSQTKGRSKT